MDLKPVELQIAVPRTSEASRIHQEQQSRPGVDQQHLAAQNILESEHQRIRSSEVDDSPRSELREEGNRSSSDRRGHQSRRMVQSEEHQEPSPHPAEHPYKGKHVDFTF
ncbi:hypothetical protein [Paenibacillus pinistramenti]|uniref:hypothetical protein n=1 Tax=Paenibacillus pinistramenti TaxID=1768003 RepID=UPI0011099113|nr:hypothetical protein [Paenibacillus pinistramenti]